MEQDGGKTGYNENVAKQLNVLLWVLIIQTLADVILGVLKYADVQSDLLPLITGVVTIGMMAVMFAALLQLRREEASLTTALVFYALLIVSAAAVVFLSSRLYTYYFFSIILLIYYYFVFSGMSRLCTPFPELSKKWEKLFLVMFISLAAVSLLAFLVYRFVFFDGTDSDSASTHPFYIVIVLLLLADLMFMLAKLVPAVWYAVYLSKSRKAFAGSALDKESIKTEE
ncbi:MAG: hypothetical protein J5643_04980 [Lachnospiraceae bacterium]|nr:hypothetical protein [Lachnospiraceae bacterium]